MTAAGVPCTPGYHGTSQGVDVLMEEAAKIGYPVLLKAVKGGGGKGMRIVQNPSDFDRQLESARSEAMNSFGDDVMLVEKYITTPRHIEVQIFADKHGNCVALGERDCSIQRRHQKILEESPAPNLPQHIRRDLWDKACAAALAVQYEGAGTVEFIFDNQTGEFFFMEMNTRLQVEHPVTEMVTGEDLVHWQFLIAAGERLPLSQSEIEERISSRGWGIEARIYAENPDMNFIPDSGRLVHLKTPKETETVRVDAGFCEGDEISSYYDPMIAKLIVGAPTRQEAIFKLRSALEEYEISGPITNIEFLKRICSTAGFKAGDVETGFIDKYHDELFPQEAVPSEVFVQAAIGLLMYEAEEVAGRGTKYRDNQVAGFDVGQQQRQLRFLTPDEGGGEKTTDVTVRYWEGHAFDASVTGKSFTNVTSHLDRSSKSISSFFPHTRLTSTIVFQGDSVDVFQRGKHYRLKCASPNWIQKALGVKDVTGSVLAPMPCKILRLEVSEGDEVKKDQPLVVLESMKMETTIRSPHDGVIAKIVHKQGELCKAGTALVEFEMPES
ncbi:MAG: hypothetical protein M1833_001634 [Piccolia ochrophora]|nr:MAG: hypothetical protein M1833_001634 [Piccolia ochrophora]